MDVAFSGKMQKVGGGECILFINSWSLFNADAPPTCMLPLCNLSDKASLTSFYLETEHYDKEG